jgi:hypothetical protein
MRPFQRVSCRKVNGSSRDSSPAPTRTDSVSMPAANSTVSWRSTSGSTSSGTPSSDPSGGNAPQLVAGEVGLQLGLAGQPRVRVVKALADQPQLQPPRGRHHRQRVVAPGPQRDRLEDLVGGHAQFPSFLECAET